MNQLPKKIYVGLEVSDFNDQKCFIVYEKIAELGEDWDGSEIGEYQLVKKGELRVKKEINFQTA